MKNHTNKFTYILLLLICLFNFEVYAQTCYINLSQNQLQFSLSGGSAQIDMSPAGNCSISSAALDQGDVPSWLSASISGGTIYISTNSSISSGYRDANISIKVNNIRVSGFYVIQGTEPPPPPCTISGFGGNTFNPLGETINYPLTFSNCNGSSATFTFLTTTGQPVPSWISISQTGTSISVTTQPNATSGNRTVVILGSTNIGGNAMTIGGQISQSSCLKTWYLDADGDNFAASTLTQCNNPGTGYTEVAMPLGDCNDSNSNINPHTEWYLDADNDGHALSKKTACTGGAGYTLSVLPINDCNDSPETGGNINPNTIWYQDADGDGFGDPSVSITQCNQPSGYVLDNTDQCPTINAPTSDCTGYSNENYVFTRAYQTPMDSSSEITNDSDVMEQITYFDGLGRPKQSISIKAGGNSEDIITPFVYDDFGRQVKEYLPYATTSQGGFIFNDPVNAVESFYFKPKYENTTNPYSESKLESSPLNRVLKQAAPGEDWKLGNGHEIEFEYGSNTATEVRLFKVGGTSSSPTLSQNSSWYYTAKELYKSVTKDENHSGATKNHTTEEFKDKQGRVVLKRTYNADVAHDTYYVYDDYGNLTYVIPPKVTTDNVSAIELSELCYQYKYDDRNRLYAKKIPGKGANGNWEEIVYNTLDQPIFTRDPLLKSQSRWLFTKYDAFGRVAYTGLLTSSSSRITLQTNANNYNGTQWVVRANETNLGGATIFYNNGGYSSTGSIEILTVNYYDNYEVGNQIEYNPASGSITWNGMSATNNVKGLPTVARTKVLGITENKWITTATYYDKKGRPWEAYLRNEYLDITEWTISQLDFTGKALKIASSHQKGSGTPIVSIENFEYDHMGRLVNQYHCIGTNLLTDDCSKGANGELIVANHYDELGQLDSKNVGGASNGNGLQTVDYKYNIRGWLKQINNPNNLGADLFAFKIKYNEKDFNTNLPDLYKPIYNGNIAETHWITANDNENRGYEYTYDNLNRLRFAQMPTFNDASYLEAIQYDKNGNIMNFKRFGANSTYIDNLSYDYDSGNKLLSVTDGRPSTEGFNDGNKTGNDYVYDANGNMMSDDNKGITNISYNHLNLPTTVTINSSTHNGNITYIYDATGTKLEKKVTDGSSLTTTMYAGNYIYENNILQFFSTPEGYVQPELVSGSVEYKYIYQYKDHLGNIRLSYTDADNNGTINPNTEIVKESNYYPFGLQHKGYNSNINGVENNHHTYLGKEISKELGLNWLSFRHRNYMPEIGRFFGVDPVAGDYVTISPYQFAHNNPVWKVELEGLEGQELDGFDVINAPPSGRSGQNPAAHLPLPVGDRSSGTTSGNKTTRKLVSIQKHQMTGYPGQALDEAVTAGIQWIGSKLTGSNVSKQTSERLQLGTSLLVFVVSKGKNAKAGTEVAEQLFKKNADDIAESITKINKKYSDGSTLNEGGLESLIDSASRYENIGEQGAKIYNSIVGQLFNNGSKRTATEFIETFAKDNKLKLNINSDQLKDLTKEISNGAKFSTEELAKRLFGGN